MPKTATEAKERLIVCVFEEARKPIILAPVQQMSLCPHCYHRLFAACSSLKKETHVDESGDVGGEAQAGLRCIIYCILACLVWVKVLEVGKPKQSMT